MKKSLSILLLMVVAAMFTNKLHAQDIITPSAAKEAAAASLKNTVITIDGKQFDYRILKHYTQQQLTDMPAAKRNQVHFIYTQSYHVIDMANCPTMKDTDIDVAKLEIFRKEDATTTVLYGNDCKVSVQLISRKEMQQLMDVITSNTK